MKRRLIAGLLCLAMVLTLLPILPTYAYGDEEFSITSNGEAVTSVSVNKYEQKDDKVTLSADGLTADAYQWQIRVTDELWVNITGASGKTIDLSYAMVASLLDANGTAAVRCVASAEGETVTTKAVTVTVDGSAPVEIAAASYQAAVVLNDAQTDENDSNEAEQQSDDTRTSYNVIINYVFENGEIAADPYTATLAAGSNFSTTVTFPTVQGYLPYVNEIQQDSIELNYTSIDQDYTINVVYKPTNVDYTVIHYQQNLNDDYYTEFARETKQGLTNSQVPEVAKNYEGFYALLYEKPAIAADGSTVVEVYYDRYYYLMNFDLDGGYGVEPIYARYGSPIIVGTPTKQGYAFLNWNPAIPDTMPARNETHSAVWGNAQTVDYTVVYWKENANDSNYSFWGQVTKQAVAGTTVSGADDIPTNITTTTVDGDSVDERVYFTYNSAKTNKNVVVNGDGTTIVNVYYYRNTYHLYFYGISGTCAIEEHTHGDGNCNSYLDCLQAEHEHDDSCVRILACTLDEHDHTEACYSLVCDTPEHDHEQSGCSLICGESSHTHNTECYADVGNSANPKNAPKNPQNGQIYERKGSKYIYINGTWYNYDGSAEDSEIADAICGKTEGVHNHTDACYDCGMESHTHYVSCWELICGQAAHTHSDSCYVYTCGAEQHTHTDSCYRPCTKLEHTHTNACQQSSSDNVIYVISAKYEQNIADIWPTAEKFSNYTLKGWTIDGINSMAVSKRVSMTADLCDTGDNLKYCKANSGGTEQYLYYMFESFDQTSPANGNQRKLLNGTYYDSDSRYYQKVNSGATNWGQKPIEGMVPVNNGVKYENSNKNVFLYYNRNRSDLMFNNSSDGIVKSVADIMYEQPLKEYTDSEGVLLSSFVPSYPSKLEPNAYEFQGWYTTPECYDGTEFDFGTATMPNGDLTLYAKWAPVTHTVSFYLNQDAFEAGTKLSTHPDVSVLHGSKVEPTPEDPENGSYTFVGWFYMDGGEEKAFDFANMPVNKDLQVYGKWSSNVLKQYFIYYKYKDNDTEIDIADPTTGSGLAGVTKTFDAKGGTELYAPYQEGYFPVTKSHSLTLDIENDDNNRFTFYYVQKEAVPYTVKYLNKETGEPVATEKTVADNRKAVVTETFVPVSGMMPDAYQKRLVVSAEEGAVNEIIFYYVEDTEHAYYKITHYTENLATDSQGNTTWTEYASSEAVGDIGTTYTAEPLTISGFSYDSTVEGTVASGELTANGLELKLYYTRNSYPYQVRYLEEGTSNQLADPKNGTGKYGQVISESAIDIADYNAVDPTSQTLNIRIEESTEAKLNIITFYYKENEVTIHYQVVGPDGCGTVTPTSETLKVLTGTAQGSTAAVTSDDYRFVGWYKDQACTQPVTASDGTVQNGKFTPAKVDRKNVAATYYAKFEENYTTLTIRKSVADGKTYDQEDVFIFDVTGPDGISFSITLRAGHSKTITKVKVGAEYTVTERTGWSSRYKVQGSSTQTKVLTSKASDNEFAFTNILNQNKWLTASDTVTNTFKPVGE